MNNFFINYLLRLYREFNGDFIQVMVTAVCELPSGPGCRPSRRKYAMSRRWNRSC